MYETEAAELNVYPIFPNLTSSTAFTCHIDSSNSSFTNILLNVHDLPPPHLPPSTHFRRHQFMCARIGSLLLFQKFAQNVLILNFDSLIRCYALLPAGKGYGVRNVQTI